MLNEASEIPPTHPHFPFRKISIRAIKQHRGKKRGSDLGFRRRRPFYKGRRRKPDKRGPVHFKKKELNAPPVCAGKGGLPIVQLIRSKKDAEGRRSFFRIQFKPIFGITDVNLYYTYVFFLSLPLFFSIVPDLNFTFAVSRIGWAEKRKKNTASFSSQKWRS